MKLVISTGPTQLLEKIAAILVEERLVACVNLVPAIKSIYFWNGSLCRDEEAMAIFKTDDKCTLAAVNKIETLHTYDLPEIICIDVDEGKSFAPYLTWVKSEVTR